MSRGWPIMWGGGPTPVEQQYEALELAVGTGHAAPQDGVDWAWREAEAVGLAMAACLAERAASQLYASSAPDLTFFRELFSIPESEPEESARRRADELDLATDRGVLSEILAHLKTLDSRFTMNVVEWDSTVTTQPGRYIAPEDGSAPYGLGRQDTIYPAVSTTFFVAFTLDLGSDAVPGEVEQAALSNARAYLAEAMPAWMGWELSTGVGFVLDSSPLDLTAFDVTA